MPRSPSCRRCRSRSPAAQRRRRPSASDEDAETISRTLLLAQRTADSTIAQANADAESITVKARVDATTVIDNARSMADKLLDEARLEGRRSAETERIKAENEVQALLARRDFLLSDVDHLEHHLGAQRERLRDAAVSLQDLIERVPGGLGDLRRPLLSASAESLLIDLTVELRGFVGRHRRTRQIDEVGGDDNAVAGERATTTMPRPTSSRRSTMRHRQNAPVRHQDHDEGVAHASRARLARCRLGHEPSWSTSGDDPLIAATNSSSRGP